MRARTANGSVYASITATLTVISSSQIAISSATDAAMMSTTRCWPLRPLRAAERPRTAPRAVRAAAVCAAEPRVSRTATTAPV